MKIEPYVIQMTVYMAFGAVLISAGVNIDRWQFWMLVMIMMLAQMHSVRSITVDMEGTMKDES
jgi:hypothetical protein